MSQPEYISARRIFTGERWFSHARLVVQESRVVAIEPLQGPPQYELVVPSFLDLQLYGAGDQLFSLDPSAKTLSIMYEFCLRGGTSYFLPTLATNTREVVHFAIQAVRDYWSKGGVGCLGLHLEGPWLNPVKRGAHEAALIHPPTREEVEDLLKEGEGVISMITLAPEVCDKELISLISSKGIRLSAGHTNASFEEAREAFENDISLITHLFNAMSSMQHRSPGMVGAVFSSARVMASIIADGHHVDWAVISLAKKLMGDRLFAITDAVATSNSGPYRHQLVGDRYEANGTLSGSSLTMLKAFNNLVIYCNLDVEEALKMCSLYPARAIGLQHKMGKIEPGYEAKWMALERQDQAYTLTQLAYDPGTF